jgi:hypothetical protein
MRELYQIGEAERRAKICALVAATCAAWAALALLGLWSQGGATWLSR